MLIKFLPLGNEKLREWERFFGVFGNFIPWGRRKGVRERRRKIQRALQLPLMIFSWYLYAPFHLAFRWKEGVFGQRRRRISLHLDQDMKRDIMWNRGTAGENCIRKAKKAWTTKVRDGESIDIQIFPKWAERRRLNIHFIFKGDMPKT